MARDKENYNNYMREYQKQARAKAKANAQAPDFSVVSSKESTPDKTLDLGGKGAQALLDLAKKAVKSDDIKGDDKTIKTIEKVMEHAPAVIEVLKELFSGFNAAAANLQATRSQQQQAPTIQPPAGWEQMSGLKRLGKKYSNPDWYAAGEAYDMNKTGSNNITPVNTAYVDPNYTQPPAQQQAPSSEPKTLKELGSKYPELPVVSDGPPAAAAVPEFVKQRSEKEEVIPVEPEAAESAELIEKMREDNNKYIELAFNWIAGLTKKEFDGYIKNIDKWKAKISMAKLLLPTQTKEMLKNTPVEEFVETFKAKVNEKYLFLEKANKLDNLKLLFEELKEGL